MQRLKLAALMLSVAALSGFGSATSLQPDAEVSRYCFICDDWQTGGGNWAHNDYQLFLNDQEGTVLHSGGYGACWQHDDYGQPE